MEPIFILLLGSMVVFLGMGYVLATQVLSRFSLNSAHRENNRASVLLSRYAANIALARGALARRHRELEGVTRRLRLSNEELARLNNMKSRFLSMVVHDVRSPLAAIKGFSALLSRRTRSEKERAQFANIIAATDQLGRLIADLTDLAMIEAGKLTMNPALFDLRAIAGDVLPGLRVRGEGKGVELLFAEPPEPVLVNGDRFRLAQVLMNLLTNSLKFTPAGGKVELSIALEGPRAEVRVKDSGIGIHPSETKKIFGKFYQAKYQKDAKLRKQGWGLGLSIAVEIIRAHQGEIAATSPGLDKGSTFYYKIPLAKNI